MKADKMYRLRSDLREDGIIFCYSGYMTEDVLFSIGKAIKEKLIIDDTDKSVIRLVFSMFVEQVQNVIRYSDELESRQTEEEILELRYGVLAVGRLANDHQEGRVFVAVGNMVKNEDVKPLNDSLSHIKTLDADGLKHLYKKTLKGETPEGSKGAGVGFIDIARKSKNNFDYDFFKVDDSMSFFTVTSYA